MPASEFVMAMMSSCSTRTTGKPWDERMGEQVLFCPQHSRNACGLIRRGHSTSSRTCRYWGLLFLRPLTHALMNGARQHHSRPLHRIREAAFAPTQIRIKRLPKSHSFANVDDFEDADKEPLQQFDVAAGCDVGEYAVCNKLL